MDAAAKAQLDARDAEFARRLSLRDETVLADIDSALAPAFQPSLRKGCRPGVDQDAVLSDTLHDVWDNFDPNKGVPVRHFYSVVLKRRMIDANRKEHRRKKERLVDDLSHVVGSQSAADSPFGEAALREVDAAMSQLSERQRLAIKRRFRPNPNNWAAQLEEETGKPARQWRKASDEALKKLKRILKVPVNSKGGRDEFVRSRHSA